MSSICLQVEVNWFQIFSIKSMLTESSVFISLFDILSYLKLDVDFQKESY